MFELDSGGGIRGKRLPDPNAGAGIEGERPFDLNTAVGIEGKRPFDANPDAGIEAKHPFAPNAGVAMATPRPFCTHGGGGIRAQRARATGAAEAGANFSLDGGPTDRVFSPWRLGALSFGKPNKPQPEIKTYG